MHLNQYSSYYFFEAGGGLGGGAGLAYEGGGFALALSLKLGFGGGGFEPFLTGGLLNLTSSLILETRPISHH